MAATTTTTALSSSYHDYSRWRWWNDDDNDHTASLLLSSSPSSSSLSSSQQWGTTSTSTTLLPVLIVSGTFWCGTYLYGRFVLHREFSRWHAIHNVHHGIAITLATLSLWHYLPEQFPIGFSLAYFSVDAWDCFFRSDWEYLLHAMICLVLGVANYIQPTFFVLKMNSKATYCELSTPFLHWSKETRRPHHFLFFAVVFTLSRIVWIPIMYRQLLIVGQIDPRHPMMIVLAGFYVLNGLWWTKILRILYRGSGETQAKKPSDNGGTSTNDGGGKIKVNASSSSSAEDIIAARDNTVGKKKDE